MKDKSSYQQWLEKPADIQFLLDSGLLFVINREVLHPLGLALIAKKDEQGKVGLAVKDGREKPEELLFANPVRDACQLKLRQFMKAFGHTQMHKRRKALGWACQWVPPEIGA